MNMFSRIYPFGCCDNQSNSAAWTKIHIFGRGLLKEHFCKTFVKISATGFYKTLCPQKLAPNSK